LQAEQDTLEAAELLQLTGAVGTAATAYLPVPRGVEHEARKDDVVHIRPLG
jgi:hypothetical protein